MRFFRRQYFRRFLRPINRMRLSPAVIGRTAAVGLAFGLTASVGIQFVGVFLVWLIARSVRRPINLVLAILLTGVSNPFTIAPIYTMYFFVGCGLVQCDTSVISIDPLIAAITQWSMHDIWESSWDALVLPLGITFLGSLPFAIAGSTIGYYFGHYVGDRLHIRRVRRAAIKAREAQANSSLPAPS